MPRYIDADELYRATQKRIAEAHEARMAVVDDEFLDLIDDAFTEDVVPRTTWISVEERLPEKSCEYLCVSRTGVIYLMQYSHRYKAFNATDDEDGDRWKLGGITHWMPLPDPPKGE